VAKKFNAYVPEISTEAQRMRLQCMKGICEAHRLFGQSS